MNKDHAKPIWRENKSAGLRLFLSRLQKSSKSKIIDTGFLSGENIQFLSSLGFKVYADTLVESLFDGKIDYEDEQFDGILLWEAVDKIAYQQAQLLLEEVERILKPGGVVFMVTSSPGKKAPEGAMRFRIKGKDCFEHTFKDDLLLLKHHHTNRELMKLLERFNILCFNLLKTGNREVVFEKPESK